MFNSHLDIGIHQPGMKDLSVCSAGGCSYYLSFNNQFENLILINL